ncbi:hypothetical protein [Stappia indica]|uniref:hypothetical protein n=1 Tax=Stappia indica TaxID=538381 RepID=UPI0008314BC7|nr:hypothetical protein [Stappia indica]MCC4243409.1 hypothetical protein [Stappia indica]
MTVPARYPVTQHAVLRYLARVMHVDLRPFQRLAGGGEGRTAPPAQVLAAFQVETGIDIEDLRRKILPPELLFALRQGAARIRCKGHVCLCTNGTVITVLAKEKHRGPLYSAAEMRRGKNRHRRRRA